MQIDPFAIKKLPKHHPNRLVYTGVARAADYTARLIFPALKIGTPGTGAAASADYDQNDTAVTPPQMGALIASVAALEEGVPGHIAEIGSFRGVTTRQIATNTTRTVHAIDPFMGYGGAEQDLETFRNNTADLANVVHLRTTSGEAARNWSHGPVALVFVDAVHDYANTAFDAHVWAQHLASGGYIAMHDVDNPRYAGTHLAAWRLSRRFEVVHRVEGLVVLRKP